MANNMVKVFLQSTKGKIIIASFVACFALLLAWGITRIAFGQMLTAVEKISAPNDKLRLVNELTHNVARLDPTQTSEILNNPARYYSFFKKTKQLVLTIDTLKKLYADDKIQTRRINLLKRLLIDRDGLFINYLKVREGLINNKSFSNQVKILNNLVNKSALQNDSTVTTTEKKTSTTTIFSNDTNDSSKVSRGFFSKLFGKKKPAKKSTSYKVVDTELNVTHDTLSKAIQDSLIKGMGKTMRILEKTQLKKSALFVNKESGLVRANNKLIRQILAILKQVQNEAFSQIELNNSAAKYVVHTSITKISIVMLVFFMLTVILLYFILTDITRSNRYRKELEFARDEAEYHGQAKHRFLSNMSHEIRTPLQSIIGYTELIMQQKHPRREDINAISQSSQHLMQIVNEVLDYNRIISGKFTFINHAFNMRALLDEVVSGLRLQAINKGISLLVDYQIPDSCHVEGDAFRLKQILYNILGNAIKFTKIGEVKLTVWLNEEAEYSLCNFTISDTGIGLSVKDLNRVFNEFEQVHDPGSENLNGTGLGLPISKVLIESQGGIINVKSTPGEGSDFSFFIKYKKAAEPAGEHQKSNIPENTKYNKVWIVDDDDFILDLCCNIFDANNVPYRSFRSPAEILNEEFDNEVKSIFLDIRMPGMNGAELCRILRKRIPINVKIFALTAQVMPGENENILHQGFDGVLIKPFKMYDLLDLISRAAENTEVTSDVAVSTDIPLDISKLRKMTFDDQRQLTKILKRFTEDCIDDIAELRFSMGNNNSDNVILLVHRMAGRTAQIGANELAADFRMAEIELMDDEQLSLDKINDILVITDKLQNLIRQIRTVYLNDEVAETIE